MQQSSTSTGSIVAGFIVWLAQNRIAAECRHRCPAIVEQFLDWQHHQRQLGQPHGFDAYRNVLAQQGATPANVAEAEHATQLLGRYLSAED
ncbi:MAG TPA: hypothetical protein VGH89_27700 [Pseudonocardia sp.]